MRAPRVPRKAPDWAQLLTDAVNTPGVLSSAYSRFWKYSVGNQLLAIFECFQRKLQSGPIHTFVGWLELGRHVKKGEKAITLCMPITINRRRRQQSPATGKAEIENSDEPSDVVRATVFVYKSRWFVLDQTEGDPYTPTEVPEWSESLALNTLQIERVTFTHLDGNCQGFARHRQVAVSPVAVLPHKTLFHEMAHVVHGHTEEGVLDDHDRTPKNLKEVEAECVALICCESLNLPGSPESRGYIQHWLKQAHEPGQAIPPQSAQRIFRAADRILKAGRPAIAILPPELSH